MHITFLGTRGGIEPRSPEHPYHSALLIKHYQKKLLIDYGADWAQCDHHAMLNTEQPDAILITHAHNDHAGGLASGVTNTPVYATQASWDSMQAYAIPAEHRHILTPHTPTHIAGFTVTAFLVEHSLNAPAVGYRITYDITSLFYVPDLVRIFNMHDALHDLRLYIGDGARLEHPIIREKDGYQMGHTSIKEQLSWCQKMDVPRAIFTHCGSPFVRSDFAQTRKQVRQMGKRFGVHTTLAYHGMSLYI